MIKDIIAWAALGAGWIAFGFMVMTTIMSF